MGSTNGRVPSPSIIFFAAVLVGVGGSAAMFLWTLFNWGFPLRYFAIWYTGCVLLLVSSALFVWAAMAGARGAARWFRVLSYSFGVIAGVFGVWGFLTGLDMLDII